MFDLLVEILACKRDEVEQARRACPLESLKLLPGYSQPRRDFYGAVTDSSRNRPNLIAEIKKASPSAGLICTEFDPVGIAREYEAGGAGALSVLTDRKHFDGRLEHLDRVKAEVSLPVLRKDFLIDPYQLYESRAHGADAVLLIAEAVGGSVLQELVTLARGLGLCVLLEVHTRVHLLAVLDIVGALGREGILLGINNRDLRTGQVDLATTERLAPLVPPGVPMVAESGIRTAADVQRMHAAGARAVLIGQALLESADRGRAIRELLGRSRSGDKRRS